MDRRSSLGAFLAHYFPTFICAFFLACFALSCRFVGRGDLCFDDNQKVAKASTGKTLREVLRGLNRVLFPVLGLLLLQSQRQRDMRDKLVAIRRKREALRGPRS